MIFTLGRMRHLDLLAYLFRTQPYVHNELAVARLSKERLIGLIIGDD